MSANNNKEKMVTVKLPRERGQDAAEIVWVNDRRFEIKRGVEVEVPECVYEVLMKKEQALDELYNAIDANAN